MHARTFSIKALKTGERESAQDGKISVIQSTDLLWRSTPETLLKSQ